jgi:hypothetical protein
MRSTAGIVYRKDGKYLRSSEATTHTGYHHSCEWVDDLDNATVFYGPVSLRIRSEEGLTTEMHVKVFEQRAVVLAN